MTADGLLPARGIPRRVRWPLTRIGDHVELHYGKALTAGNRRPGDIPVYGSNGQCGWHDTPLATGPTVVLGRKGQGPLGVEWCSSPFWVIDTAYFVTTRTVDISLEYFYYLTKYVGLNHLKDGVSNPSLGRDTFYRQAFPLPPFRDQESIVAVLSGYDDLIENNTKRIKILEEMTRLAFELTEAQAIGAPKRPLGDIADAGGGTIRTGPFGSQLHESDYTAEGTPVVMPKNLLLGRIDTSDIARVPDDIAQKVEQHHLSKGDIVYGRRGDIGRRAYIGRHQEGWICGTGCLRISLGSGPLHSRYLHEFLGKPEIVSSIAGKAIGATMPNLNTSILRGVEVPIPDAHVQQQFVNLALANDDLVENLRARSAMLTAQRDILLPRLISGEIELDP